MSDCSDSEVTTGVSGFSLYAWICSANALLFFLMASFMRDSALAFVGDSLGFSASAIVVAGTCERASV
jgi:hypothetical protein